MTDHLAKEADRLSNDPVFIEALKGVRAEALDALATADADDKTAILRLQQKVAVVDEIRAMLSRFILKAGDIQQDEPSPYA